MSHRLNQVSFAAGELSQALSARVDLSKYAVGLAKCRNFIVHRTGGCSNRAGFQFLGKVADNAVCPKLIPFQFNATASQSAVLEFGDLSLRIWKSGGLVTSSGSVLSVTSPFTAAQAAEMGHAQSKDVVYLAHKSLAPRKLSRSSWTSWSFGIPSFVPTQPAPSSVSAAVGGAGVHTYTQAIAYVVTAVNDDTGEESIASTAATLSSGPSLDDWQTGCKVVVTWSAPAIGTIAYYRVYKALDGTGVYGYVGRSKTNKWSDSNKTPNISDTPPTAENPFENSGDWPSRVALHQQRLCFAATENDPNRLDLSKSGFYESFAKSTPTKDDDAITVYLSLGGMDAIKALASVNDLLLLTQGAECVCNSGTTGGALTPSAVVVKPQSFWGSGDLPAIISGNTALFVQDLGSAVRDMAYDFSTDGFVGNDRSVLARHFLDGFSIVDWAYAQTPDSTFWMVRNDGALLSLTYFKEQDVGAWALHTTDGSFERVCVIPGDDRHELYAVIKRTINGQTVRYIERMASRFVESINDANLLDSSLTYDGDATEVISGLDHLEGKTVQALADGDVITGLVVTGGSVTLPRAYSHVVVGLPYEAYIQTLPVDLGMVQGLGSVAGRSKAVTSLTVRVQASRELRAGPALDNLALQKVQAPALDTPQALYTKDLTVAIPTSWGTDGSVVIAPNGPVPLTVLAVMPDIEIAA